MAPPARPDLPALLKWMVPAAAIAAAAYLAWVSPVSRPTPEQMEEILAEADTALLERRLDAAAAKFQRIAVLQPGSARANFGLGLVRMHERRYADALTTFDRAMQLEPGNPDHAYARARTLTLLGRRDEAIAALAALHEADPGRLEVEIDWIAVLIDAQRWSDAKIAVTDALGRAAGHYNLRLQAGRIEAHAGNHPKAIEHYEMARQIRPYAAPPVYGLIEEYRALGRIDDARTLLPVFEGLRARAGDLERLRNTALAAPADPAPSIQYLERLFEEGWLDEAVEQTNIFLNLHPDNAGCRGILLKAASTAAEMGDEETSRRFLELAGSDVLDDRGKLAAADVLVELGDLAKARTIYEERLRSAPEDAAALIGLGRTALKSNQVEEAENTLKRALASEPGSASAHAALGLTLAQKTDLASARAEFEAALVIDPRQADALFGLGFLAQQRGRSDEAERYLRQALNSRPGHSAARVVLALTLSNKGRCGEAIPLFTRALQFDYRNMTLHAGLVRCLEESGRTAEAMQARRIAEQLLGKNP